MTQAASDTCALNAKALATHQESFEEAQQEAEEAAKLTVNDVADGTTLETLKDAITLAKAVESAPACPASGNASDFTKATDDIRKYADNLRNITNERRQRQTLRLTGPKSSKSATSPPLQAFSHHIGLIYGRFDRSPGDISLIYGRSFRKDRS